MTLSPATGPYLAQILENSYPIWNDGLTPSAYARYWDAQIRTPWGAAHLDRVALVDGDTVVSSLKRYDLNARLDGRIRRVLGLGAVFTSPAHRGRGAARELLQRVLATAVTEGYELAALFSEIAPAFYERLDFVPVPLHEIRIAVRPSRGSPAVLVRAGDQRDLPAIAEMSARRSATTRLALERSEELIRFGLTKRRLLAGLGPPGLRQVEFLVVEEGYTAVAYVIGSEQDGKWFIEEAGDRDPAGARVGAMMQAMLSRLPAESPPEIRAWWPHDFIPPQVEVAERYPTNGVLMIRALTDGILAVPPLRAEDVAYWRLDYF
ncbi:MAG: GNAT family N-acetyltransferase [Vicinamibacterales bacterium]